MPLLERPRRLLYSKDSLPYLPPNPSRGEVIRWVKEMYYCGLITNRAKVTMIRHLWRNNPEAWNGEAGFKQFIDGASNFTPGFKKALAKLPPKGEP